MPKFEVCTDCECSFCFKSFECGTDCTNPLRCSVDCKPKGFCKTKSDKWDYRTKKIMKVAKIVCPMYINVHSITNLLLRKDHIQQDGQICKKDKTALLNLELDYLAKRFDEMYQNGQISLNWRD